MDTRDENELVLCPFCAEEIKAAAIKCKHCGEMLGPRTTVDLGADHESNRSTVESVLTDSITKQKILEIEMRSQEVFSKAADEELKLRDTQDS